MRVIVLEGINGAGKSLLAARLERFLSQSCGGVCLAADPTSFGLVGQVLREQLVHPSTVSSPDLDAVLFTALRSEGAGRMVQLVEGRAGSVIILERWSMALAAYGAADGARTELVAELRRVLDSVMMVDLAILLDIDGDSAAGRLAGLGRANRFEARGAQYLETVAEKYRAIAANDKHVERVDSSGEADMTFKCVQAAIARRWPDIYAGA